MFLPGESQGWGNLVGLLFLPAILIPACASSSPAFLTMYSAYKLNKQGQGLADASLLKKMGFEVEKRGDKLILKSTSDTPQLVSIQEED